MVANVLAHHRSFGSLVASWVCGSLLAPNISTTVLPSTWTLELLTSIVVYFFLFLGCLRFNIGKEGFKRPTSPWMAFPSLIIELSKFLPYDSIKTICKDYKNYKEMKIWFVCGV
ncbi:hypothetical protein Droror1_Dr00013676 [Drosera rotundifolia]